MQAQMRLVWHRRQSVSLIACGTASPLYDLRRSLSLADRESLYLCLGREERLEFARVAFAELSTFWNYTEQGGKVSAWAFLKREARMAYMLENPDEMPAKCSESWTWHLGKYGWDDLKPSQSAAAVSHVLQPSSQQLAVLVSRGLRSNPKEAGRANPEAVPSFKAEISSVKQEQRAPPVEPITAEALEAELTVGSVYTPVSRSMCDLAQVIRGLVAVCNMRVRKPWTAEIGILNAGNEQRARLLRRQVHVSTLFAVVYSDNPGHWALLVVDKTTAAACLYDGMGSGACADMARAFLLSDELRDWAGGRIRLFVAEVAPQQDAWSCGHRVMATANLVLEHLAASGNLPKVLQGPCSEDIAQFIAPAAPASGGSTDAPDPQASSGAADRVQTPKRQKRDASGSGPGGLSPPAVSPKVAKVPRQGAARRRAQSVQVVPRSEKSGKQGPPAKKLKCSQCPVSHTRFQKAHYQADMAPPKGHWATFQEAFDPGCSVVLACSVCQELFREARPAEPGAPGDQVVPADDADAGLAEPQGSAALQDGDESSSEESEAHQAGRPKKGQAPRWTLANWVKERRSRIYLATDRSFARSATYFCRPCNREIQFGTQTCKKKVRRHEGNQTHIKGLAKLLGKEAVVPANAGQASSALAGNQACTGCMASKLSLGASITSFVQYGQPRMVYADGEVDPFAEVTFEVLSSDVAVRSKQCKGQCAGLTACSECVSATKTKALRQAIAKQAYIIDLSLLTFHIYGSSPEHLHEFKAALRDRDYRQMGLAGQDLDKFLAMQNGLDLCRAIVAKMEHMPAWRVSKSLSAFWAQWLKRPHRSHANHAEAEALAALVRGTADAVASGQARQHDLVLASKVACGALRGDVVVESLTTSFLSKYREGLDNSRRRTTSAFANYGVLSECLATMGRNSELTSLLQSFRVNPKLLKAPCIATTRYPQPYASINDTARLRESYLTALGHLKFASGRPHMILDETTWSAGWGLVRSFRRDSEGELQDCILGGTWSSEKDEDYSVLPACKRDPESLPKERLATLALHACVMRPDCTKYLWDVCVIPRGPGLGTAEDTLKVVDVLFFEATKATGAAPHGLAFDGGSNNALVLQLFLGQLDASRMASLSFFRECNIQSLQLPYWPHGYLQHKTRHRQDILVCSNGAWHFQKRFSLAHLSGARTVRWGGLFTDLTIELENGLPQAAYLASDTQCDRAAAQRLSPPFMGRNWLSLGIHIHSLVAALISSATTASVGFSRRDVCLNGMCGMYLLILRHMDGHRQWKDHASRSRNCLADVTVRNGIALCHFFVVCKTGCEQRFVQELPIEHHFSRLKQPFRGQPSLKDFALGHRSLSSRQCRELEGMTEQAMTDRASSFDRPKLEDAELKQLAGRALAAAVQFHSFISEDYPPCEVVGNLRTWFEKHGQQFFGKRGRRRHRLGCTLRPDPGSFRGGAGHGGQRHRGGARGSRAAAASGGGQGQDHGGDIC